MKQHSRSVSALSRPLLAALVLGALAPLAQAQQSRVFAYPNAGQSQQQQQADSYQCHQWSVSQTGFDPTQPGAAPPPQYSGQTPPPQPQQGGGLLGLGGGGMFKGGGMLGDAATGAALGAAGGALAGDAGKGAALGALAAGVLGAASRATAPAQQPQQAVPPPGYQQQMAAPDQQRRMGDYNAAFGACMKARNYTVN